MTLAVAPLAVPYWEVPSFREPGNDVSLAPGKACSQCSVQWLQRDTFPSSLAKCNPIQCWSRINSQSLVYLLPAFRSTSFGKSYPKSNKQLWPNLTKQNWREMPFRPMQGQSLPNLWDLYFCSISATWNISLIRNSSPWRSLPLAFTCLSDAIRMNCSVSSRRQRELTDISDAQTTFRQSYCQALHV